MRESIAHQTQRIDRINLCRFGCKGKHSKLSGIFDKTPEPTIITSAEASPKSEFECSESLALGNHEQFVVEPCVEQNAARTVKNDTNFLRGFAHKNDARNRSMMIF